MEDEDWQEELGGDEMQDFHDDYEIMREIASEYADEDIKDRLDEIDAHCALIAEEKFVDAVRAVKEARGESGVMELVFAIERSLGWHMEIIATKADVEDYVFSKHGIYDSKAWSKAKNTDAWSEMGIEVTYSALRRRKDIVNQAFGLPVDEKRVVARKFLYELWKRIDLRLM